MSKANNKEQKKDGIKKLQEILSDHVIKDQHDKSNYKKVKKRKPINKQAIVKLSNKQIVQQKGAGRPSECTDYTIEKISSVIKRGNTIKAAVTMSGITVAQHSRWMRLGQINYKDKENKYSKYYVQICAARAEAEVELVEIVRGAAESVESQIICHECGAINIQVQQGDPKLALQLLRLGFREGWGDEQIKDAGYFTPEQVSEALAIIASGIIDVLEMAEVEEKYVEQIKKVFSGGVTS